MVRVDPFKPGPTEEEILKEKNEELRLHAQLMKNYEIAGEVAELALSYVLKACRPGVKIAELCRRGDMFINTVLRERFPDRFNSTAEEAAEAAARADPVRLRASQLDPRDGDVGVYFPTCIATGRVCGRHAPMPGAEPVGGTRHGAKPRRAARLELGELARVDVSVHVDGCVAAAAHTILIDEPGRPTAVPTARQADVVLAAKAAADVAQELLRCRPACRTGIWASKTRGDASLRKGGHNTRGGDKTPWGGQEGGGGGRGCSDRGAGPHLAAACPSRSRPVGSRAGAAPDVPLAPQPRSTRARACGRQTRALEEGGHDGAGIGWRRPWRGPRPRRGRRRLR